MPRGDFSYLVASCAPAAVPILRLRHQRVPFCSTACFGRVEAIIMSAGELEHEWAGTPGKLIRERYRRASEVRGVSVPPSQRGESGVCTAEPAR